MRTCALLLVLSLGGYTASATPVAPVGTPAAQPVSNSELHENVVTLIELLGVRQHLLDSRVNIAQQGKLEILRSFPNYSPAFADEWARRLVARMPIDDYVKVVVAAYEKNYTNGDVLEMIQTQRDRMAGKAPVVSPELRDKIGTAAVAAQSEIMAGFTRLGAKLGGEIGLEIAKEHPEWLHQSEPFTVTPAN